MVKKSRSRALKLPERVLHQAALLDDWRVEK
jgi:hypothetical protein